MDDTVTMSTGSGGERRARAPATDDADGRTSVRWGFGIGLALTAVTAVTLALALTAVPDDVPYPFTSDVVAAQWPGDYLWMYPAMLLMLLFIAFVASVHQFASPPGAIFSLLGLCFACVAATVLLIDYFIQVTAVPLSLEKRQLDGWAMLTMYNPNGVFIALEELGYLLMSLTLALLAAVFNGRNRLEHTIRWLFRSQLHSGRRRARGRVMAEGQGPDRRLRDHRHLDRLVDDPRRRTARRGRAAAHA